MIAINDKISLNYNLLHIYKYDGFLYSRYFSDHKRIVTRPKILCGIFLVPISRGVKLPHSQWEMDLNTTLIPNTTSKIFKKIMHVECSFYNKGIKVADLSNLWISIINAVLYKSQCLTWKKLLWRCFAEYEFRVLDSGLLD